MSRTGLVAGLGLLTVVGLTALHTFIGTQPIGVGDVLSALLGSPEQEQHRTIVVNLRLPRALIAVAAGACMATAGALLQIVTRNPLADPALLGITGGGVLVALSVLTAAPGLASSLWLPLIVLVGCASTGGLVLLLARSRAGLDPWLLILTGVVTGGIATSLSSVLLITSGEALGGLLPWMIGSLNGRVWVHWHMVWPWAVAGLVVAMSTGRLANLLQLGNDSIIGAGVPIPRAPVALFALAALLAATGVAAAGAVGFIGLMAPHLARLLVGDDARRVLPIAAIAGSVLLVGADVIAQGVTIKPPFDAEAQRVGLPVGAVTALLGAPLTVALIRRSSRMRGSN